MRRFKMLLVLVVLNVFLGLVSCTDSSEFVKEFQQIEQQHQDGGEGHCPDNGGNIGGIGPC